MTGVLQPASLPQFLVRDPHASRVGARVEFGLDAQARPGRGSAKQLDDYLVADEWPPTPVLGDVAEHPVLDLVPLGSPRREVADPEAQAGRIRHLLEGHLPEAGSVRVAPAAVG